MKIDFRARIASSGDDRRIIIVPVEYRNDVEKFGDTLLKVTLETVPDGKGAAA